MEPTILYQDESLMVIEKPAGWVVNDASTVKDTPTLQEWLKSFDYPLSNDREFRSGIVHRLDKETSGLLLIAKTKESFEALQSEFKERTVKKTYLALVHGKLSSKEGLIDVAVGRLPWRRDRFGVIPGGRTSQTEYKVLNEYKGKEKDEYYSLVECHPKTGRTHQIRIHLKHIGHAIVSDSFYAGRKTARNDKKWCPRLFLHAAAISFNHPTEKMEMDFTSELSDDLKKVLESLEKL
jgi:23S rRNA pseudouridine1911/1915/1917 synthase